MHITSTHAACGAIITGIDLAQPLAPEVVQSVRAAWLAHHVLSFPDQDLTDDDLERLTLTFGQFGPEPFFKPIDGREHICAVSRTKHETAPLFAEAWHTDWSFLPQPPIGTLLYGITIPPVGGATSFVNQHRVAEAMPAALKTKIASLSALHSARLAYAPDGAYGANDPVDRSMRIIYSEEANNVYAHPLLQRHAESGLEMVFGCLGYIIGIADWPQEEAVELLTELYEWQIRDEFQYHHEWEAGTLLLWDNRSVLHRANGGYDGYDRLLHRTTLYS